MKITSITAFVVLACACPSFAATHPALKGAQYLSQAKVTLAQARMKARKAESGSIIAEELEKENGGLRYSFDIKVSRALHEVGIDAMTGRVLEDSIDNGKD